MRCRIALLVVAAEAFLMAHSVAAGAAGAGSVTSTLTVSTAAADTLRLGLDLTWRVPLRPVRAAAAAPIAALATRCLHAAPGLLGSRSDFFFMTPAASVVGAADAVRLLRELAPGSAGYRCGRALLMYESHVFGAEPPQGFSSQGRHAASLTLSIGGGVAVISAHASGEFPIALPQYLGPWALGWDDGDLIVSARGDGVPASTVRWVILRTAGVSVSSAAPVPDAERPGELSWTFARGSTVSRVSARLRLPLATRAALGPTARAGWRWLQDTEGEIPLLLALLLFRRRLGSEDDHPTATIAERPRRTLMLLILAVLASIIADGIGQWGLPVLRSLLGSRSTAPYHVPQLAQSVVSLAAIGVLVWHAIGAGRPRLRLLLSVFLLVAAGFWAALSLQDFPAWGWGVAALAFSVLLTVLALITVGVLIGAPLITQWSACLRRGALAAAVTLAAVAIGEVGQQAIQIRRGDAASNTPLYFGDALPGLRGSLREFAQSAPYYPTYNALDLIGGFALLIAAATAVGVLRARADPAHPRVFFLAHRSVPSLVIVAFAAVVVGTGGELWGLSLPVAFVVALGLWPVLDRLSRPAAGGAPPAGWRRWLSVPREATERALIAPAAATGTARADVLPTRARALVDRALALERLRTHRGAIQDRYDGRGELDEQALARELEDNRCQAEALARGGRTCPRFPDASLRLPDGISVSDLALSLGSRGSWWENAKLTTAIGAGLAVFPLGYFVAVLALHGTGSPLSFLTPVSVLTNISSEIVFWLAAAFAFGALIAYLPLPTGLLKGLVLAGAYGLAILIGNTLVPVHDSVRSTFRFFELVLFLAALGVITDLITVGLANWRSLAVLYRINSMRAAILYLAPLAIVLYGVGSQLASGHAKSAVQTVVSQAGALLPTPSK